jgi:hypothetical protein
LGNSKFSECKVSSNFGKERIIGNYFRKSYKQFWTKKELLEIILEKKDYYIKKAIFSENWFFVS